MPAISVITEEQVRAAAEELTTKGKTITGWTLRTIIGSGRADRLAAIWDSLNVSAHAAPATELTVALPPAVADSLATAEERLTSELRAAFSAAWRAASELSGQRVQAEIGAARARVAELEDDSAEATRLLEIADERYAALSRDLEQERGDRANDTQAAAAAVAAARQAEATARGEEQATRRTVEHLQGTLGELVRRLPSQVDVEESSAALAPRRGPGRPRREPLPEVATPS